MRVTRLYLRNYRVYEDELELEIPPGLVGIYGPNGAGKSYLIEAIPWTLYGVSRTSKDEVRSSGVNADCVTEVEFEHEGHLYVVRRTISGQNNTVRAEAHADGKQVAEGVNDTKAYVQSLLGLDMAAFRASVYAEQKQLATFSQETPAKRRDLVLRLLGITPLDDARDAARHDARARRELHEQSRRDLPDLVALEAQRDTAALAVGNAEPALQAATDALTAARARASASATAFEGLDTARQAHENLLTEGRGVAAERDDAAKQAEQLRAELDTLATAAGELARLAASTVDLGGLETLVVAARHRDQAMRAVAATPLPEPPLPPDEEEAEVAKAELTEAATALASLDGQLAAEVAEETRSAALLAKGGQLTGEADCPLCGQQLGATFARVLAHRRTEHDEVHARVVALQAERAKAATVAAAAKTRAKATSDELAARNRAAAEYERARDRHETAAAALAAARTDVPDEVELTEVERQLDGAKAAAARAAVLTGKLSRRAQAETDLAAQDQRYAKADARRTELLAEVRRLGHDPARLDTARRARDDDRGAVEHGVAHAHQIELALMSARNTLEMAEKSLSEAHDAHGRLAELADQSRHLSRLSELLGAFRNEVVAAVGPTLAGLAADLFGELTDREYDELRVDPDTFELRIVDSGREFGIDRFSGSEVDLANLALRVAISENVRLSAGGSVGLLVLDEVFGPLDDERRARMLLALERLRARFRQVLVVTHANDVKEQLPNAIQVVKLPGRRATAHLVVDGG